MSLCLRAGFPTRLARNPVATEGADPRALPDRGPGQSGALGGWALRWLGDGLVAAVGLGLAAVGIDLLTTWPRVVRRLLVVCRARLPVSASVSPWPRSTTPRFAEAPQSAHGTASALVVVARMVGMVVGSPCSPRWACTTTGWLPTCPIRPDRKALVDAAISQVHFVFRGAAVAAALGALSAVALGLRRRGQVSGQHTFGLWGA